MSQLEFQLTDSAAGQSVAEIQTQQPEEFVIGDEYFHEQGIKKKLKK